MFVTLLSLNTSSVHDLVKGAELARRVDIGLVDLVLEAYCILGGAVAENCLWCYPSQWCEGEPIPSASG